MFKYELKKVYATPEKKKHFIFLLVLELLIYYMLGYVKNIIALNAIYLGVI